MIERPVSRQPIPPHATCVFKGKDFHIYQWEQELFDGSTATFEKAKRTQDAAVAIPVLPDGRIVIGYDEQPGRVPLTTFAGGHIEEGEDPLTTARRELKEETGYESDELTYWFGFQPETRVDFAVYFFVARNCRYVGAPSTDAGERVSTRVVTLDELIELSSRPDFQNTALRPLLIEAKYNPEKRTELQNFLLGQGTITV